ncbi:MAG: STAS/SEC14 domain-containing protein [Bacteroidia bacterium]|nr:STAS/SEC14 domain-containing protein [Bacteroidia bacterium]
MIHPENTQLIPGAIADYRLSPEGILFSYSKSIRRTVDLIRENVSLVQDITGGKPVPLLIYLCDSPMPDKATRKYSTEQLPVIYSAMAMVSRPGLSTFIMSLLFRLQSPPIPIRSFTDDQEALRWLRGFLPRQS